LLKRDEKITKGNYLKEKNTSSPFRKGPALSGVEWGELERDFGVGQNCKL
jgi:hypothetical protein